MKNYESIPTPLEKGKEIQLERLKDQTKEKLDEVYELYQRLDIVMSEKQSLLEEEIKKPTEEMDLELITLLHEDIDSLTQDMNTLVDLSAEGTNLLTETRDKLTDLQRLIQELEQRK